MRLQSRQQRSLTPFFPDVVDALGTWFRDVVLDGVIWGRRPRVHHVANT
jgi:ATP-dependent DNA ligase